MATTKTLQDFRNIYYAIIKEEEDSSAYPLVLADVLLRNAQNSICSGNITDLTTGRKDQIEKGPLPFLFSDSYFSTVQDTYIADTDLVIGGTTITVSDTTGFASAGFLWINEDIIQYTGVTSTSFTGVTGIDFPHKAGARVSQLFELASDYATSIRVIYNNQLALRNQDYRNMFLRLNNYKGEQDYTNNNNNTLTRFRDLKPFYTIINGTYLLPFQVDNSGYMLHQLYEKTPAAMVNGTDIATIPDQYSESTIPFIAAADTLYHRGEEDRALKLLNFALGKVMEMYSFYADQNNEDLNGQRVETGKDQVLNI